MIVFKFLIVLLSSIREGGDYGTVNSIILIFSKSLYF